MLHKLLCWLGLHEATAEREHVFYSNRTMIEIYRCERCQGSVMREYGG